MRHHSVKALNQSRCLLFLLHRYEQHVRWARSALLAQGLDEEAVDQVLKELTHPVELDLEKEPSEEQVDVQEHQESGACQAPSSEQDQPMEDVAAAKCEEGEGSGFSEAKRPRRQGDLCYDPLAEIYPEEPEQVDPNALAKVKCKRHDDWIVHCGCRVDASEMMSGGSVSDTRGCNLSVARSYVLVEESEEDEDGDPYDEDIKRVNKYLFIFLACLAKRTVTMPLSTARILEEPTNPFVAFYV